MVFDNWYNILRSLREDIERDRFNAQARMFGDYVVMDLDDDLEIADFYKNYKFSELQQYLEDQQLAERMITAFREIFLNNADPFQYMDDFSKLESFCRERKSES